MFLSSLTILLLAGAGKSASNKKQTISVTAEEIITNREVLSFNLRAKDLTAKDFFGFGKSDPFLTISRSTEYGEWTVVHRTEVIKSNLKPEWQPFSLSITALCNADHNRPIKFSVDDWNMNGSHAHIGEIVTTVAELVEYGRSASHGSPHIIPFVNQKKKSKKGGKYKNSGFLHLITCKLETIPTFLDFISNGTELSFTVAVDFTASNGNPQDSRSLHYINPSGAPNQYVAAIKAVGEIIQDYDSDKVISKLLAGEQNFILDVSRSRVWCENSTGRESESRVLPEPDQRPALQWGGRNSGRLPPVTVQCSALRTNQLLLRHSPCGEVC